MEAGFGSKTIKTEEVSVSPIMNTGTMGKFATWNGNWTKWNATMEAAAHLVGVGDAVEAGEAMAVDPEHKPSAQAM